MRISSALLILILFLYGCAGVTKSLQSDSESLYTITPASTGLPADGLWRENIILYDFNGDGSIEILAPPPRKAKPEEKKPFVFVFDTKDKKWSEQKYAFPTLDYDYGGIAAGDINRDGFTDIALATHRGRLHLLINNGDGTFSNAPFPVKEDFYSRKVTIADINGDGWLDIVAISEAPFTKGYVPKGLLIAINKEGRDWEITLIGDSMGLFSDFLSVGDINGDGALDIVISPFTAVRDDMKAVWLGDRKGGFIHYKSDFTGDMLTEQVRTGDIDGDGKDEIVYILSGMGESAAFPLKAFKWSPEGIKDISEGLQKIKKTLVFDLADIDGDAKKDIVLLSDEGLHIFKYSGSGWVELFRHPIPSKEILGAEDLMTAQQSDGSFIIAYSLGMENPEFQRGIRAFILNPKRGADK